MAQTDMFDCVESVLSQRMFDVGYLSPIGAGKARIWLVSVSTMPAAGYAERKSSVSKAIPEAPLRESSSNPSVDVVRNAWINAFGDLHSALVGLEPMTPPVIDVMPVVSAISDILAGLAAQPDTLVRTQMEMATDWLKLWTAALPFNPEAESVIEPNRNDRRFKDDEWSSSPYFNSVKQAHLIASKHLRSLVRSSAIQDPSKRAYANVVIDQFLDAVSPTNFPFSNPVVVRRTIETGGANLVSGFANLLADVSEGKGLVKRRAPDIFKPGVNIAVTPGGVIFQNDLMQVIQYSPATPDVRKRPLLYVPPLVNKFYMIDLQPKSSLIRWLVEQGETVFAISWVDPDESHRNCEVADYVSRGVIEALDIVREATGETVTDLFGFCMGGTLAALAEAVLVARGEGDRIGSTTLIGSLVDFSDMKEWTAFVNETQVDALDQHVDEKGYIDKVELQQLFSAMRANDLIWSPFINHYLLGVDAPPSDLLYWFEDGSHIPQAFLRTYNRTLLLQNHLREPGAVSLLGESLDLTKSVAPKLIVALKDDHVSAWTAVYQGTQYFGGSVEFVLGGSGHNAGVINPPAANKHGYWTNPQLVETGEQWLAAATRNEGSWWPHWAAWLQALPGNTLVPARQVGDGALPQIEPAPGSFVTGQL
ncbi:class I poly(R)-hydroxyalkanoic acid synthase [Sphingobium lactosutens]|uniref:alpha/beta fold hydrolase n=1 Tax=Sphingobium lactosutens TaxID=522773 RepID=UPI0015B9F1C5|nr:alpha/beta fold hydrolase [Sphingobium lactosutens]NWK95973.1 class I poly(R)-hydroxyalkanoic acid synthase [Sphingobium lactosutens]